MNALKIWFALVLLTMIGVVSWASFNENLFQIPPRVGGDPWFIATLFDTYFAFIVIYLWMAYRSPAWPARIFWFFMVMGLGNIGISAYFLLRLFRLPPQATVMDLLRREST